MTVTHDTLIALLREARREHYSEAGIRCDKTLTDGEECTCGASEWNAKIDQALEAFAPPLLQCVDCRNTESCAGAMARVFNHGRCMHCGGSFKVVRA